MSEILETYNEYINLTKRDFDLEKYNQYAVVHHSNSIEGSTLTLNETYLLLDEKLTPKNKPVQHTLMALEHLKALKYVIALANEKAKISENILKNISGILQKNTGKIYYTLGGVIDTSKGDYRLDRARAGESIFKAEGIEENMKGLVELVNTNIAKSKGYMEVNKLAFDAHFIMVSIHPFGDGNGRTSRLLQNYIQQYHKFPLTYVFEEDKSDYHKALVDARDAENMDIFSDFMFFQANKMMKKEIEKIKINENKKLFFFKNSEIVKEQEEQERKPRFKR